MQKQNTKKSADIIEIGSVKSHFTPTIFNEIGIEDWLEWRLVSVGERIEWQGIYGTPHIVAQSRKDNKLRVTQFTDGANIDDADNQKILAEHLATLAWAKFGYSDKERTALECCQYFPTENRHELHTVASPHTLLQGMQMNCLSRLDKRLSVKKYLQCSDYALTGRAH